VAKLEFAASVSCGECRVPLDERSDVPIEERQPCPRCGSTARYFGVHIQSTVRIDSHLDRHSKHRHQPNTKPHRQEWHGESWSPIYKRYMQRDQVVDRENNRYSKRVVDPTTGEVLREADEPLTDHTGYGAAKRPPKEQEQA
jgi:hypothetical protein